MERYRTAVFLDPAAAPWPCWKHAPNQCPPVAAETRLVGAARAGRRPIALWWPWQTRRPRPPALPHGQARPLGPHLPIRARLRPRPLLRRPRGPCSWPRARPRPAPASALRSTTPLDPAPLTPHEGAPIAPGMFSGMLCVQARRSCRTEEAVAVAFHLRGSVSCPSTHCLPRRCHHERPKHLHRNIR